MSNVSIIQTNKIDNKNDISGYNNPCNMCGVNTFKPCVNPRTSLCSNCNAYYDPKLEKIVCIMCDMVVIQSFKKSICLSLGSDKGQVAFHITPICKNCNIGCEYYDSDDYWQIKYKYERAGRSEMITELNVLNEYNYEIIYDIRTARHAIICADLGVYLPDDISKMVLSYCLYPRTIELKKE